MRLFLGELAVVAYQRSYLVRSQGYFAWIAEFNQSRRPEHDLESWRHFEDAVERCRPCTMT
jgi:hypothetical protein